MKIDCSNKNNFPDHAKTRLGKEAINDIRFSPDGTQMTVARGISIMIYDAFTGAEISLLTGHTAPVNSIVYRPDGNTLISYGRDGTIRLWDLTEEKEKITLYDITETSIYSEAASISPDGQLFVFIPFTCDHIELWDIATFTLNKTLDHISWRLSESDGPNLSDRVSGPHTFIDPVFSPDGCTLSIGQISLIQRGTERDILIHLWDFVKDSPLKSFWHELRTSSMVFSPDGSMFTLGCEDGIELWNNTIKAKIKTFTGYEGDVYTLTFSPDGRTLAAGCKIRDSGTITSRIYLWDVTTGCQLKTFTGFNTRSDSYIGHTGEISSMCFSPDGCTLASGCKDGIVMLWDVVPETNKTPIVKESTEFFDSRPSQIRQICEERGIETLVHFTRIENLRSILQQGLIGRGFLEAQEQQFLWNDADRVDGHPEANCLSISFPNYQMFYSIREGMKLKEVNDSQWIVLLLDAKVLWELDCAFCQRNAASNAVRTIPLNERKKTEALKGMFDDFYDIKRQDLSIPQNYPTHPQAEVLVFDRIPTEYINAIHFWDATILKQWRSNYTGTFSNKFFVDRKYFDARSDFEVWRPKNFNDDGIPLSYFSDDNDEEPDDFNDYIPF